MEDSQYAQPFGGKWTLRCRKMSRSEERASRFGIQRNGQERHHEDKQVKKNERSELSAMEHQNFLFDMERIRPYAAKMCNKFNTLLDLKGCSGDCISEESQSSTCIYRGRTRHKLFSKME
ncbi:hypothetical protein B296_00031500 [Ensete ventricosum]|uniref:Uncharacterized protein n=1 Tax=Ensete ventricosum TaxID=4639 RepID=A0A426YIP0_ENSVE|nr:hypothetical protein B296_00031500 [Ensete ventricosum]